jgi:hypothetical protein
MNMDKPPDETLKQGRNRSWLLVKFDDSLTDTSHHTRRVQLILKAQIKHIHMPLNVSHKY